MPLQRTPRRRDSNRDSNRVPQIVTNPRAAHQWVYNSSDFDTTPASDESRHGAVLHRLNTSTASSFFDDPAANNREPIACSSPRRLNETQLNSSDFLSLSNAGFENDEEGIDEIELRGAVGGVTAAAAAAASTGNAPEAQNNEDDEEVVFDAETFL